MTTIRRPTGDPRRRNNKGRSLCNCRNFCIFLFMGQVLSVLLSTLREPVGSNEKNQQHEQHGIEFVLNEFQMGKDRLISETEKRLGIMKPNPVIEPLEENGGGDDDDKGSESDDGYGKSGDGDGSGVDDGVDKKGDKGDVSGPNDTPSGDDGRGEGEDDDDEEGFQESDELDEPMTDRGGISGGGYVVDYLYNRVNPSFRKDSFASKLDQEKKNAEEHAQETGLKACSYFLSEQVGSEIVMHTMTHSSCVANGPLIAYNSQPFPRDWCGKTIASGAVERFDEPCKEPVKLFPVDAARVSSAEQMSPIVIRGSIGSQAALEDVTCDIPCKQEKGMKGSARIIEGTPWKLSATKDDPAVNANARMERGDYRKNQFYSTTSFKSAVPQSFFSFDEYDLRSSSAVDYNTAENAASYLINDDCKAQSTKRQKWLDGVKEHFTVAALGKCDHNTETSLNVNIRSDRIQLMKQYRFNLAFETSAEKDRITEIVWEALQAGTVPVVVGAQNIMEHLPSNSFILSGKFQDFEELGKYIKTVAENKTLYESFHAWRDNPDEIAAFDARYEFTRTSASCRTCRWAYAKKYGLGWNHTRQVLQENAIPRIPCTDQDATKGPFQESWISREGKAESLEKVDSCDQSQNPDVAGGYTVNRQIFSHDGVVDMSIKVSDVDSGTGDLLLRLETQIENIDGGHFPNPHSQIATVHGPLVTSITIQDEKARMTVIASWNTVISSPHEGAVDIMVHKKGDESMQEDETRRIRVVTEDTVNDKITEFFPSSFLDMMTRDFVDPLSLFSTER